MINYCLTFFGTEFPYIHTNNIAKNIPHDTGINSCQCMIIFCNRKAEKFFLVLNEKIKTVLEKFNFILNAMRVNSRGFIEFLNFFISY